MKRLIFAGLALALTLPAQSLSYKLLSSSADGPSPRYDGTIAYDTDGKQLFLFGGQDSQSTKADLWTFSVAQGKWAQLAPTGLPPQARFGHTLIFDSSRRRLILFGGQAGGFFSDVWAYQIESNSWTQLARDAAGPSRRYGHSAIYDAAHDRMVISHGFTDAGRFDDTWAFDFKTNLWTNISPAQGRPLRRCLHHAAYDAANSQMFLYGGCSSGYGPCPQDDLWSFDLNKNTWTQLTSTPRPAGRDHYGMAFDATRSKLVVFGGSGSTLFNDTWEFDPKQSSWQNPVLDAGGTPAARSRHEAAAATDLEAVFFFGGSSNSGFSNELWSLTAVKPVVRPIVSSVTNAFSHAAGAIAPGELLSIRGLRLGPDKLAVSINNFAAPVLAAASDTEFLVQAPYELDGAEQAKLVVTVNSVESDPVMLPVAATKPGLWMTILNEDGSPNSPDQPAAPGSLILLQLTGQGATVPPTPTGSLPVEGAAPEPAAATNAMIGDQSAEIVSRVLSPDALGVLRLVVRIPGDYANDPAAKLVITVGTESVMAVVAVQQGN